MVGGAVLGPVDQKSVSWCAAQLCPAAEPSSCVSVRGGSICVVRGQRSGLPPDLREASGSLRKMLCISASAGHSSPHVAGHLQLIKEGPNLFYLKGLKSLIAAELKNGANSSSQKSNTLKMMF